jgi:hypothetical protein
MQNILVASILILVSVTVRLIFNPGVNIELITVSTLLAGQYLGKRWACIVPLAILALSDAFIGNTSIFLFTWSAFFAIGALWAFFPKRKSSFGSVMIATSYSVGSAVVFFLWTNFGVWFLDSWGMYPKTFHGLISAYVNGIPFLRANVLSNILIVPSVFIAWAVGLRMMKRIACRYAGRSTT